MADPKTVEDLTPDPENARKRTQRNLGMIVDSLQQLGSGRSILIDEEGKIIAGNGVAEGAVEAGITKLKVVDAEGDEIVAVRRKGLTDDQKTDMALRDNRVAETSEWDGDRLKILDGEGKLTHLFTPLERTKMFGEGEGSKGGEIVPIDVKEKPAIVWMLMGIPVAEWPKHQTAIEKLQQVATIHTATPATKSKKSIAEKVNEKKAAEEQAS